MVRTLTFLDGVPVVDGLRRDVIELADGPYMERFHLLRGRRQSIRLHHLLTDDPDRDLHDHPWDFTSLLLTGAYRETTPDGVTVHEAPAIVTRRAEELHRLELLDGPMWTYVVCGLVRRPWGFMTAAGWVPWQRYRAGAVTSRAW